MEKSELTVGDIVTLKSGGPDMTVTAVKGHTATCKWFNGAQHEAFEAEFPDAALTKKETT